MKLLRYGLPGQEKPGLIDSAGTNPQPGGCHRGCRRRGTLRRLALETRHDRHRDAADRRTIDADRARASGASASSWASASTTPSTPPRPAQRSRPSRSSS